MDYVGIRKDHEMHIWITDDVISFEATGKFYVFFAYQLKNLVDKQKGYNGFGLTSCSEG